MNEQTEQNTSIHQPEKTIQSHYDYADVLQWVEKKGRELYGTKFRIISDDHPVIYRLISYFLKDEQTAFQFGIDLEKGILLAGPVGCGKTTIMNVMKHLTKAENKFSVKPCRDISIEFINEGYSVIQNYSIGKQYHREQRIYCLDDLGIENNLKYYGNEYNVIGEVLLSRYDIFISRRIPTHVTTNLSASEIEAQYGIRVRSRLRELCNLIAYDKNTKDKR